MRPDAHAGNGGKGGGGHRQSPAYGLALGNSHEAPNWLLDIKTAIGKVSEIIFNEQHGLIRCDAF